MNYREQRPMLDYSKVDDYISSVFHQDYINALKEIQMKPKTKTKQKRKYTKRAAKWGVKTGSDGNRYATLQHPPLPNLTETVKSFNDSITWTDKPQQPGLHVMRVVRGTTLDYMAVRAVLVNDGITECYSIKAPPNGGTALDISDWTQPHFQKIFE